MKLPSSAAKWCFTAVVTVALTGCSVTGHKSAEDWQNKIWRGPVMVPFVNTSKNPTDTDFITATKFDLVRDKGIRLARVHVSSGWSSVMANAVVPDNIEFSDIPKGTLVDVIAEFGTNMDHSKQRFTRILRIVCARDDDKCMKAEKDAGRYQAVVNSHPAGETINAEYGVRFTRRISESDIAKYD